MLTLCSEVGSPRQLTAGADLQVIDTARASTTGGGRFDERLLDCIGLAARSAVVHERQRARDVAEQSALHLNDRQHADDAIAFEGREIRGPMPEGHVVDGPPLEPVVQRGCEASARRRHSTRLRGRRSH